MFLPSVHLLFEVCLFYLCVVITGLSLFFCSGVHLSEKKLVPVTETIGN